MGRKQKSLTYSAAGVNIDLGDRCSEIAYSFAKKTFPKRTGIGKAVRMDGGFTGALDMGNFFLVQNDDTVGTKMMVAEAIGKFDTLGFDLAAMVADDAVCVGAEVISISNTIMTDRLSPTIIRELMKGLSTVCQQQKIVIPGGEIANLEMVKGYEWGATAVGIVEKKKFITGRTVRSGDCVIGIRGSSLRSNGYTLARKILQQAYGKKWAHKKYGGDTWGAALLKPSIVHHAGLLALLGRYGAQRKVAIKALAHITGGGIPGNLPRILHGLGADLPQLPAPPRIFRDLARLGSVSEKEAYRTWNMGVGMMLVTAKRDVEKTISLLKKQKLDAVLCGTVSGKNGVRLPEF